MSADSKIEWTDATWNPVTGCTKVSAGCDHCYAETFAERWRGTAGHHFENGFDLTLRPERLDQPHHWKKPRRVFVNSMSDLFHQDVPDEYIAKVWQVMASTSRHTYQILTKRHARMRAWVSRCAVSPGGWITHDGTDPAVCGGTGVIVGHPHEPEHTVYGRRGGNRRVYPASGGWPLPNVWLGVSVEDQHWADVRIPALCDTPAAVRFLSCEPLLGPIDLSRWMPPGRARWQCGGCRAFFGGDWQAICAGCGREGYWCGSHTGNDRPNDQPLSWVIVGGESGPGARLMDIAAARTIVRQCGEAGVPAFVKQLGSGLGRVIGAGSKGGDMDRWPADLRVREFPRATETTGVA